MHAIYFKPEVNLLLNYLCSTTCKPDITLKYYEDPEKMVQSKSNFRRFRYEWEN